MDKNNIKGIYDPRICDKCKTHEDTKKIVYAKIISVNALFAIILIAESKLEEKEIMIALIMNFLQKENV